MRSRYILALLFLAGFVALEFFFLFNSGAGHGWGTGAMVILTLPLGLIALGLDYTFPQFGFVLTLPLFGLIQAIMIGYLVGRYFERRK